MVVGVGGPGGTVGTWASMVKAMSAAMTMTAIKGSLCSVDAFVAMAFMKVVSRP